MIRADGTFMVWSETGGQKVKPLNWMTPPTVIEEEPGLMVAREVRGVPGSSPGVGLPCSQHALHRRHAAADATAKDSARAVAAVDRPQPRGSTTPRPGTPVFPSLARVSSYCHMPTAGSAAVAHWVVTPVLRFSRVASSAASRPAE